MCGRRPRKLPPIISAQGLSKRYGVAPALPGYFVHRFRRGIASASIGPNGSANRHCWRCSSQRPAGQRDVAIRKGDAAELRRADFGIRAGRDGSLGHRESSRTLGSSRCGARFAFCGNAGPTRALRIWIHALRRFRAAGASGWPSPKPWCRRCHFAFGRAHQPSGSRGDSMARIVLRNAAFACVVVSHDRYFLENVANEMVELNRAYENGALRVGGNYSAFLRRKKSTCMRRKKGRSRSRIACTRNSNGCAVGRRREPPRPRRASIKLTR